MKEHKGWAKLSILNLNYTGLTDVALDYLGKSSMPKLKKLNIQGNKFSDAGKANINALRKTRNVDSPHSQWQESQPLYQINFSILPVLPCHTIFPKQL